MGLGETTGLLLASEGDTGEGEGFEVGGEDCELTTG